jgi:hypothetical protein
MTNDLKFTTCGDYMKDVEENSKHKELKKAIADLKGTRMDDAYYFFNPDQKNQ